MLKNAKGEYENPTEIQGDDIRLTSKNQELVFEGGGDNEGEDEVGKEVNAIDQLNLENDPTATIQKKPSEEKVEPTTPSKE